MNWGWEWWRGGVVVTGFGWAFVLVGLLCNENAWWAGVWWKCDVCSEYHANWCLSKATILVVFCWRFRGGGLRRSWSSFDGYQCCGGINISVFQDRPSVHARVSYAWSLRCWIARICTFGKRTPRTISVFRPALRYSRVDPTSCFVDEFWTDNSRQLVIQCHLIPQYPSKSSK